MEMNKEKTKVIPCVLVFDKSIQQWRKTYNNEENKASSLWSHSLNEEEVEK